METVPPGPAFKKRRVVIMCDGELTLVTVPVWNRAALSISIIMHDKPVFNRFFSYYGRKRQHILERAENNAAKDRFGAE